MTAKEQQLFAGLEIDPKSLADSLIDMEEAEKKVIAELAGEKNPDKWMAKYMKDLGLDYGETAEFIHKAISEQKWVSGMGNAKPVSKMDTSYLVQCIRMIQRKKAEVDGYAPWHDFEDMLVDAFNERFERDHTTVAVNLMKHLEN